MCGFNPLPETRWIQRTAWHFKEDFMVSYLWRHIGSVDIEAPQVAGTFPAFRSIDSADKFSKLSGISFVEDVSTSVPSLRTDLKAETGGWNCPTIPLYTQSQAVIVSFS